MYYSMHVLREKYPPPSRKRDELIFQGGPIHFEEITVYIHFKAEIVFQPYSHSMQMCSVYLPIPGGDGWMGSNSKGRDDKLMIYTTL